MKSPMKLVKYWMVMTILSGNAVPILTAIGARERQLFYELHW
jgi:hypothetical protein